MSTARVLAIIVALTAICFWTAQPSLANVHHGKRACAVGSQQRLDRLAKELSLTDSQKTDVKALFDVQRAKVRAIKEEKLTSQERRTKIREVVVATRKDVRVLLTPEQQTKLDEMHKKGLERREARKAKEPVAPAPTR